MKLNEFLKITKAAEFEVFVYPEGHTKENRGLSEAVIEIFPIKRDSLGKIESSDNLEKYKWYTVREIIPCCNSKVNVVVE